MSSNGGITNAPLKPDLVINWIFCLEQVVCGILTLFFLFYFNRVFATLLSYGLRGWSWHKYRVYVDIQSLQVSLLGGRIFFNGFRYHGNNETIFVQSGHITWRYWFRNVRHVDVDDDRTPHTRRSSGESEKRSRDDSAKTVDTVEEPVQANLTKLPCRLIISLKGVEWFVYNRTAAYDAVMTGLAQEETSSGTTREPEIPYPLRSHGETRGSSKERYTGRNSSDVEKDDFAKAEKEIVNVGPGNSKKHQFSSDLPPEADINGSQIQSDSGDIFILRFLPIQIDCEKAAVVLGNQHTKSVLVAKMDSAKGQIDASNSSNLDLYKQLINFEFEHPIIQVKPNNDYKEDQITAASRIKLGERDLAEKTDYHLRIRSFLHRQHRKLWHRIQDLMPALRGSVESLSSSCQESVRMLSRNGPGSNGWKGLSRYLDENEQDDKSRWSSVEYATVFTILDSTSARMSFYWDVVGKVREQSVASKRGEFTTNINGDEPPEWGIDLFFKGATINYGPWADRQRANLQQVFFPALCKDSVPAKCLGPGQLRVPTEFKLRVEFDGETTLRVPIKEDSKNWKWSNKAEIFGTKPNSRKGLAKTSRKRKAEQGNHSPEVRPFGWLDFKVGSNATVTYRMDMVAGPTGFSTQLDLDLPDTEITTSVNHGLLWRSTGNRLSCDLSNPLKWNGLRTWKFDMSSNGLELFVLREHIFLLIDMVDDWASGSPPEYLTFSPFKYLVKLHLNDFKLYFNVNDSNIINNPSDFDDNTFVILFGAVLDANVCIPLDNYRPYRNDISFDVCAQQGGLDLHVPPWNTQATFLSSKKLATLQELDVDGKYQYCSNTSPSNTDTLLFNVHGQSTSAIFYGFAVRYFIKIKDNYFGDDIRFKTLEEYQEVLRSQREDVGVLPHPQPPYKKSNDLDVILSVSVDQFGVMLPSNLYCAKNHIRIDIATLTADLRFTNYYMDIDMVLSTLGLAQSSMDEGSITPVSVVSSTQLFVDGINVSGNRLFGLPPTEPTYVCNWDFSIGAVTGECTTEFLVRLINGARAFAFSFDDDENALPPMSEQLSHDITFLRASLDSVRVWLHVEEAAFLLSTATLSMSFNDWAGAHYSKKLNVFVPELKLGCVDAESASRHRCRTQNPVETHALVQTSVSITMIQRKLGFEQDRLLQQEHVKRHDQLTRRTGFLLHEELVDDSLIVPVDAPTMLSPPLPVPALIVKHPNPDTMSLSSGLETPLKVGRKHSFLSLTGSSIKSDTSILRPHESNKASYAHAAQSRSRSLHATSGPSRRAVLRDHSTSTGRQSSFYSAIGESRVIYPSNATLSSSYMAPYFPLEGVEPDGKDLPDFHTNFEEHKTLPVNRLGTDELGSNNVNKNYTHTSFIILFPGAISGVINPRAVYAAGELLKNMQAVDPTDLLDELQIDSMNTILKQSNNKVKNGTVFDVSVQVPSLKLRFLNLSDANSSRNQNNETLDQYDLSVCSLSIMIRSEIAAAKIPAVSKLQESLVLHIALGSAGLAAKERYRDLDNTQAAINGVLKDLVLWADSRRETTANLAFRDLELATSSSKVRYLTSLLHRTDKLARHVAQRFSSQLNQERRRLQLFTYLVATTGQRVLDPLFLTRPSYVLRSAIDHLRTNDSWKIVTRLRHMYNSLDSFCQQDIASRCAVDIENLPQGAEQLVRTGFDQWRSWDLNSMDNCLVISKIYGQWGTGGASLLDRPVKLSAQTELVRLLLDPGPKQNAVSLSKIAAELNISAEASTADIDPQSDVKLIQTMILELFIVDVSVSINWELRQLAEDILILFREGENLAGVSSDHSDKSEGILAPEIKYDLHVVVGMERACIDIDTINLKAASFCRGLQASFTVSDETSEDGLKISCVVLAADSVSSNFKSRVGELSVVQLGSPIVYASYQELNGREVAFDALKVAGNCHNLELTIKKDVLALLEVLDLLVVDEIAQLYELTRSNSRIGLRPPTISSNPPMKSGPKASIALFLSRYKISVPLLQSLVYTVSGDVARASVAAQLSTEMVFDFDIKEHSHDMRTILGRNTTSISLLKMPPTNGRTIIHVSEEETTLSVLASVEPVVLDAAAVHSLLTAINRPEVSSVIVDLQEDLEGIQAQLRDIFGFDQLSARELPKVRTHFVYDAHLALAGFDIFANAQGADKGQETARLDLNLGSIEIVATNRLDPSSPILEYPELRISLHHIMFQLARWNNTVMEPCGNLAFQAFLTATSRLNENGHEVRLFHVSSEGLNINLFADTASSVVDVLGHLQNKMQDLDLSREKNYLRRLRKSKPRITVSHEDEFERSTTGSTIMFESMYSLDLHSIQISWLVGTYESPILSGAERENLILSLRRIDLSTRRQNSARLKIEDLQLQMVPSSQNKTQRSLNSAILPEVIFNVGYVSIGDSRRLAFQASGKSLDLRLTSQFMIPALALKKSITSAAEKVHEASASWNAMIPGPSIESQRRKPFFGKKRMESLLVDADFAGAVVNLSGKSSAETEDQATGGKPPHTGRYGQFTTTDSNSSTILRAPGLACKIEYRDNGKDDPSLNAEVKVDASSNILYPSVVPLILEMSSSVREIVSDEKDQNFDSKESAQNFMSADDNNILSTNPSAVLGRTKLNLGLRICRQEFSLSCQPIARVAATARFEDIYMAVNTLTSSEHGHFFAASAAITKLQASVQHVYSRESTGSFDVNSVILSLMNSKHVSGTSGLSAILKISPMNVLVNAKQLEDFLLFREIWVPFEKGQDSPAPSAAPPNAPSQIILVQRYHQVASTGAFPWNATISITELDVKLDLGQAIGKSAFVIMNFWISSKKNSDWEQNLCLGFDRVGVESTGRMSGFFELQDFKLQTSIQWPTREMALNQIPLVQGSLDFSQLRIKAAFDYQAFLVADITLFQFLMHNIRTGTNASDRLVAIFDGEAVQVFCTTTTASQVLAVYQAFQRLVHEKRTNYEISLSGIEKFIRRRSVSQFTSPLTSKKIPVMQNEGRMADSPISLHTDVIVTLKAVNVGAFPNTFSDHQVFKLEALDAQARFSVTMDNGRIHSTLGLTLGQLRIGLAGVKKLDIPKSVEDISVEDVVSSATGSRGGTILKVPKVEATMQTWQVPKSTHIDYIFKSFFEGKVEVGWNYSRISYIRNMWAAHSKALAQRLGKPLPPSAVRITGVPDGDKTERKEGEQQKITAEVYVPQSKYDYTALEPPIIETPQLRDMGEATPPLEWIGLHRERLPNLTHQIVIVTLLELASEVGDAYGKILGSS